MAFTIYKSGQGYWTRMLSAIGAGLLVLSGVYWICYNELPIVQAGFVKNHLVIWQAAVAATLILGLGALLWWTLNHPRVAEFMIATEGEMRKVNWPTRREIIGSTWIVICGTLMMAVLLAVVNFAFINFFQWIRILPS